MRDVILIASICIPISEPSWTLGITNYMGQGSIANYRVHSSWKQKSPYQLLGNHQPWLVWLSGLSARL